MIKRGLKGIWRTLAFSVIGLAVLIALLRISFGHLAHFQPELERYISEQVHAEVHFGEFRTRWRSFGPQMTISAARLRDPASGAELLTFERFHAALDIWRSILAFKPVMREFSLQGLRTTIELDENGRLTLPGLKVNRDGAELSAEYLIDLLMRQRELSISETLIHYRRHDGHIIDLDLPDVRLRNFENMHQATGDLRVEKGGTAGFVLEFSDYPFAVADTMDLYVESRNLDLARLPFSTRDLGFELDAGTLELKMWAQWRQQGWRVASGDVGIRQLRLHNAQKQKRVLDTLQGKVHLRRDDEQHWTMHSTPFEWLVDGEKQTPFSVSGEIRSQNDIQTGFLDFRAFDLHAWLAWLTFSSKTPDSLRDTLQKLSLQADIPLLQLDWRHAEGHLQNWSLGGEIKNIRYIAGEFPSVQNVHARLVLNSEKIAVRITGNDADVHIADLFPGPLSFHDVDVAAMWHYGHDDKILWIPHLKAINPDAELHAVARVDFSPNAEPEVNVLATLKNGVIANKSAYMPVAIMSESLTRYLNDSIRDGELRQATALLRGPLSALTATSPRSVFAVEGDVRNARMQFDPHWPMVRDIDARLRFTESSMDITVGHATMLSATVRGARVAIPDTHKAELVVSGDVSLTGTQAAQLVQQTPLQDWIGSVNDVLRADGELQTELALTIPLDEKDPHPRVNGDISFSNIQVQLVPVSLSFAQVSGHVLFNEQGLSGGELQGDALGGKWVAHITQDEVGSLLRYQGDLRADVTQAWQPHPLRARITGATNYEGELHLPRKDGATRLLWRSDLRGITVNLPAPYGKTDSEPATTDLELLLDDERNLIKARYADKQLVLQAQQNKQAGWVSEILLGDAAFVGDRTGLSIRGKLDNLDFQPWLHVLTGMENSSGNAETDHSVTSTYRNAPALRLNLVQSQLFGESFSALEVNAEPEDERYRITVNSKDLSGKIFLQDKVPIQVQLQTLRYGQRSENAQPEGEPAPDPAMLDIVPDDFPEIEFSCDQCSAWGYSLGSVQASILAADQSKKLSIKASRNGLLHSDLNGVWSVNAGTQLNGIVRSNNFGKLLDDWQLTSDMKDTAGEVRLNMNWVGSPFDYSLRRLHLDADIDWKGGYITTVSDAKARLFSLLSLQSITRRLSLDFRDLYKNGFFYDDIKGKVSIQGGIAMTDKLSINGATAAVDIRGNADLLRRQLDQQVLVVPKLSSSLPVLLGWAINPAVGALTWLVNQLFQPVLKVVTSLEYRIVGSFDAPQVIEGKRVEKEVKVSEEDEAELEKLQKEKQP